MIDEPVVVVTLSSSDAKRFVLVAILTTALNNISPKRSNVLPKYKRPFS